MSIVEIVLFMAIVNGNPSNPEVIQKDSVMVMMEDVKKKKKKGKKLSEKGKKKKKGFFSKVFGSK
tara:strand:+ start:586 stop:780 length:195 start_codon:yes stop_codon:yes gene_type:complete